MNYSQHLMPEAVMLATNQTFFALGLITIFAAFTVWLSPKPKGEMDGMPSGH
jgi:DHA2 family multidrug resistance protein